MSRVYPVPQGTRLQTSPLRVPSCLQSLCSCNRNRPYHAIEIRPHNGFAALIKEEKLSECIASKELLAGVHGYSGTNPTIPPQQHQLNREVCQTDQSTIYSDQARIRSHTALRDPRAR